MAEELPTFRTEQRQSTLLFHLVFSVQIDKPGDSAQKTEASFRPLTPRSLASPLLWERREPRGEEVRHGAPKLETLRGHAGVGGE